MILESGFNAVLELSRCSITINAEDVEQDCPYFVAVVMVLVEQYWEEHQHGVLHPLAFGICSKCQVLMTVKCTQCSAIYTCFAVKSISY